MGSLPVYFFPFYLQILDLLAPIKTVNELKNKSHQDLRVIALIETCEQASLERRDMVLLSQLLICCFHKF